MSTAGASSHDTAATQHAHLPPTITSTTLTGETFAISRLRTTVASWERSEAPPALDAFIFVHQLHHVRSIELWSRERVISVEPMPEGTLTMFHLDEEPGCRPTSPKDCLQFFVTRDALDAIAAESGAGAVDELNTTQGISVADPLVHRLGRSLLPMLDSPAADSGLFVDEVSLALQTHLLGSYCRMRRAPRRDVGGLARWQERRVKEMLVADLGGHVSLADLAVACGVSRAHLLRAFKQSVGQTPHQWLAGRRVQVAKEMMARGHVLSLGEIALAVGFRDASRFSQTFARLAHMSPSAWRRAAGTRAPGPAAVIPRQAAPATPEPTPPRPPRRGGLTPWQERRARELMVADPGADLPVEQLARECGLSRSHFTRAFRVSTGSTPHRWLQKQRVTLAQGLMVDPTLPLEQVARRCGFAHQSHFTRVFTALVGVTPAAWRRANARPPRAAR